MTRHEELIAAQVPQWRMYPAVPTPMCFRGFQILGAAVLVAEMNDVRRFAHPAGLMAYPRLAPPAGTTHDQTPPGSHPKASKAQEH